MQNGYIESFNGKLRDECLNLNCLRNLNDARERIGRWREHYNSSRSHSALGYLTPAQFAAQCNAALTRTAAPGQPGTGSAARSAANPKPAFFRLALKASEGEDERCSIATPPSLSFWVVDNMGAGHRASRLSAGHLKCLVN
jgi:hypothetical protein